MIYLKSVLVGLLALFVIPICTAIVVAAGTVIYTMARRPSGEGSVGWDPISLIHQRPIVWLIFVLIFFAGFMWEYRRLT
jgi:energy-converting hydrogenase Eha subunit G